MTDETRATLWSLAKMTIWTGVVSVPFMLWLGPRDARGQIPGWTVPVVLTAVGLTTKLVVHHFEHSSESSQYGRLTPRRAPRRRPLRLATTGVG